MQRYTSANTSINSTKVPAVFRKVSWEGGVNFDIGGGKYDTATEYLKQFGVTNLIYDPYNRPLEHNIKVMKEAKVDGVDTCTISNVLNVIDSYPARLEVLHTAKLLLKDGGFCFITVYEGDRSSKGRQTGKDQWQNNKPLRGYLQEVKTAFHEAYIENGMIVAVK